MKRHIFIIVILTAVLTVEIIALLDANHSNYNADKIVVNESEFLKNDGMSLHKNTSAGKARLAIAQTRDRQIKSLKKIKVDSLRHSSWFS